VAPREGARWRVPVIYGGSFGEDLIAVAAQHGLTPDEVIARHAAPEYRVYMIGFMPGYTYLGGLDPSIATPRRAEPRLATPAGSIAIGGVQASIQCLAAPSGWHLLGRTPARTYHPTRDPMFLMSPGDRVSFYRIPATSWDALDRAAQAGEAIAERLPS
jgi:KipI family sensor histidine kinase inhibitor